MQLFSLSIYAPPSSNNSSHFFCSHVNSCLFILKSRAASCLFTFFDKQYIVWNLLRGYDMILESNAFRMLLCLTHQTMMMLSNNEHKYTAIFTSNCIFIFSKFQPKNNVYINIIMDFDNGSNHLLTINYLVLSSENQIKFFYQISTFTYAVKINLWKFDVF